MTAYRPGAYSGAADNTSQYKSPLKPDGSTHDGRRNFYATKFVAISNLLRTGSYQQYPLYSERGQLNDEGPSDIKDQVEGFENVLQPESQELKAIWQ